MSGRSDRMRCAPARTPLRRPLRDVFGAFVLAGPALAFAAAPASSTPAACSTTRSAIGSVDGQVVELRAARNTGVAPLMVFWDVRHAGEGSDTAASQGAPGFASTALRWDYGDAVDGDAGRWSAGVGADSRNVSAGPMGAHWYDRPGRHVMTLSGPDGKVLHRCSVQVQAPDAIFTGERTACFSTGGDFAGCPAGALRRTTDDWTQVLAETRRGVRRLLLHRGDRFRAEQPGDLSGDGPGSIGVYGDASLAPPRIEAGEGMAQDAPVLRLAAARASTSDWRITGLHFDGARSNGRALGITALGPADQISIGRNRFSSLRVALLTSPPVLRPSDQPWDQIAFVDNRIADLVPGVEGQGGTLPYGVYLAAERVFFAGNELQGAPGRSSHNARFPYLAWGILDHNTLRGPGATAHNIKLHAPQWPPGPGTGPLGSGQGYSRWIQISANRVESDRNAWQIVVGPQSPDEDERVRDVRIVGNQLRFAAATQIGIVLFGTQDVLAEDNTIDARAARLAPTGVYAGTRGKSRARPADGSVIRHNLLVFGPEKAAKLVDGDGTARRMSDVDNEAVRCGESSARSAAAADRRRPGSRSAWACSD